MKTAVSIPDATFERAERCARELGVSRSELYSKAVDAWVSARDRQRLTQQIDDVLSTASHDEDLAFLSQAAAGLVDPPEPR